ncbi:MAG: hypothetical protein V1907_05035 [Candidatus Kerfeldbacteria bacterium]
MSLEIKTILGALAALLIIVSYFPYVTSVVSGRTRPHAFSWFVWALLSGIAFFAMVSSGAGTGSWETGVSALGCLIIFFLAITRGDRRFSSFDWTSLGLALLAIVLWRITHAPITAAILVTLGDALGFLPTYHKGFVRPHEEHLAPFAFGTSASGIAFFALQSYSPAAWLYPASLVITNGAFVLLLLVRRKRIPQTT